MKKRIGKIFISSELIKNMNINEMLKVTSKFVVIRCEHLYCKNEFEYIAICPEFDEIEEYEAPPTYYVECKTKTIDFKTSEIVEVKFIRQK